MDGARFDRIIRRAFGGSRRGFVRALLFAATAVPLTPVRIARAELAGVVVLGGSCASTRECRQQEMHAEAICADNGFASDGALNCCVTSGCCVSDADCCHDLRCAPTGDVCSVCRRPPFATRDIGQVCSSDQECIPSVVCAVGCVGFRCACRDAPDGAGAPDRGGLPAIPDTVTALAAAAKLSRLEATGRFAELAALMHPDARAIVPAEVVIGWYGNDYPHQGEPAADAVKVRFNPWTWEVTGKTYPVTADVALRQALTDGTTIRDEVRLVQDAAGNWGWFFGRDRAFVEEQIARYGQ